MSDDRQSDVGYDPTEKVVPIGRSKAEVRARALAQGSPSSEPATVTELWDRQLILNEKGSIKALLANAILALRGHNEWAGVLAYDEFAQRTVALRAPPWRDGPSGGAAWQSSHDVLAADWLQRHGIHTSPEVAGNACEVVARETIVHPVRDYLKGLVWDGKPRLDKWTIGYLGVAKSDYAEQVGAKWMVSAVARVMRPGCKVDCCLILEGPQGLLKSTALRRLGSPWFTDEVADLGTKDSALQLGGAWILELSELDSMSRSDMSKIKAFMTRNVDRFRPPYGKRVIEAPRQCVFAGTTNKTDWNLDETGGRRFWPLACTNIDIDGISSIKDQLWAEAKDRFEGGETWWLTDSGVQATAREMQADRYHGDPWDVVISEFAQNYTSVTIAEILYHALSRRLGDWTQIDLNRVQRSLLSLGYEKFRDTAQDGKINNREWRYRLPNITDTEARYSQRRPEDIGAAVVREKTRRAHGVWSADEDGS